MMIRKPPGGNRSIPIADLTALETFASRFAGQLKGGDIVALTGGMGSGKTTFAQLLCQALGIIQPITSPTFSIFNQYKVPAIVLNDSCVLHGDFYRLNAIELEQLMPEYDPVIFNNHTLTLLEWADLYEPLKPFWTWQIDFRHDDSNENGRLLMLYGKDTDRLNAILQRYGCHV